MSTLRTRRSDVLIPAGAKDFPSNQSRPDMGPTKPLFFEYRGSFPGVMRRGVISRIYLHLAPRLKTSRPTPVLLPVPSWRGEGRIVFTFIGYSSVEIVPCSL